MISLSQTLNKNIKMARKTPVAKAFLVGCSKYGFIKGFSASKYDINNTERLYTERLAWGFLYAGLYRYLHPLVVYRAFLDLETRSRGQDKTIRPPEVELFFPICHTEQ